MITWRSIAICSLVALASGVYAARAAADDAPYLFTPSGAGIDDTAALYSALIEHRWVQINGSDIQIDQTVELKDGNCQPLDGLRLEPAPGIASVTVHTRITKDPNNPTNPSRTPFEFDGTYLPGSYLLLAAPAGSTAVQVQNPATLNISPIPSTACNPASTISLSFNVGDYVYINDTTNYLSTGTLLTNDGAAEIRKITAISQGPTTQTLSLDRPLLRSHIAGTVATHAQVIHSVTFRNLQFTSDYDPTSLTNALPRSAIHLHNAERALIEGITSTKWAGYSLVLLDTGGVENVVRDTFASGVRVPSYNGWGIAMEGQESSSLVNCGASNYTEGIVINYSYETIAYNTQAISIISTALDVHPDFRGNPSIGSGFIGGTVSGGHLGVYIGPSCVNCASDVTVTGVVDGIQIGLGATSTTIRGAVLSFQSFGIAFEQVSAPGQPLDGQVTSTRTSISTLATCGSAYRLALVKGSTVTQAPGGAPYYSATALFAVCP